MVNTYHQGQSTGVNRQIQRRGRLPKGYRQELRTGRINHTLALQNKNKELRDETLFLSYSRPNDSTILLSGIDQKKDSIHVVLEKIDKKYMMFEGRRKPVKI
jgi:hypothetical protein